MATASIFYLTNIEPHKNWPIKLSYIECYADDTEQTINSITSGSDTLNVSDLLVDNNTDITLSQLDDTLIVTLASAVPLERYIYFRFKTHSDDNSWIKGFNISYFDSTDSLIKPLFHSGIYIYPGIDTLTDAAVFSTDALSKTLQWDSTKKNSYFTVDISELGTSFSKKTTNSVANRGAMLSNLSASSGKWYVEFYFRNDCSYNYGITALGVSSDKTSSALNISAGSDAQSVGFKNIKAVINGAPMSFNGDVETGTTGYVHDFTGTKLLDARYAYNFIASSEIATAEEMYRFGVGVGIDLDNKSFLIYSLNQDKYPTPIRFDFPFNGPYYLIVSNYNSTSGNITQEYDFVNLGYRPFRRSVPVGFTAGFGTEISVSNPSVRSKSQDLRTKAFEVDDEIQSPDIDISSSLYGEKPYWGDEQISTNKSILKYTDLVFEDIQKAFNPVEWVYRNPPKMRILVKGGFGYIKSTVRKMIGSLVPIRTRVFLINIDTYLVEHSVYSSEDTGEFEFKYLDENCRYNIVALDPQGTWVSAIAGPISPQRMVGLENEIYDELATTEHTTRAR